MALNDEYSLPCVNFFPDPLRWVRPVSGISNGTGVPLEDGRVFHAWSAGGELRFGFAQNVRRYISENSTVSPTPAGVVFTESSSWRFGLSKVGERIYIPAFRVYGSNTFTRIYYSDDTGETWTRVDLHSAVAGAPIVDNLAHSGCVFKTSAGTLLAVIGYGRVQSGTIRSNGGVWRSTDDGASWSLVHYFGSYFFGGTYTVGMPNGIIQDAPEDGGRIYFKWSGNVLYENVRYSDNDGASWGSLYTQGSARSASYHTPAFRLANGMAYMSIGRWNNSQMRVAAGETYASFMGLGTDYNMRYMSDSGLNPVHHYWVQAGRYVYATERGRVASIALCLADIEPPLRLKQRDDQNKYGTSRLDPGAGTKQAYSKQGTQNGRLATPNTYF